MSEGRVIVTQFVTLDGVVEDPDGSGGTPGGGWAFRSGPKRVAGDDFELGSIFDTGVLLVGRTTWDVFSRRWPDRAGEFADAMNRIPKIVVSRSATALDAWSNSSLLEGDLVAGVAALTREHDVVVLGSTSVVHALAAADAVDEYRLLVMPTVLGAGERLFVAPVELHLTSVKHVGEAVLARYVRRASGVTVGGFEPRVVRAAYEAIADEYSVTFGDDLEHVEVDRRLLGALAEHAVGRGPVLDIGCGPAQVSRFLAGRGAEAVGVDFAPAMLHVARAVLPGLAVAAADLRALPVRTGSVAGAVAFYVLQHLPRSALPGALREIRRVLVRGGPLVVAVHAGEGEFQPASDITATRYTAAECRSQLVRASFSVESVDQRDPLPHERPAPRLYVSARAT